MGRLIAFLVMAVLTSPAWAACPSTLSDCTSAPVYSVVTGWQGVLGGPWTTSTRPANPANGLMGFNTTLGAYEYYNGSWAQLPPTSGGVFSNMTVTGSFTATGLVTNADLVNSGLTLGSTPLTLGGTTTSVTGLTLSAPTLTGGVSGNLVIPSGKVLTASNTLAFTGTDGTSFLFPSTSDTVGTLGAAQTYTGAKIFTAGLTSGNGTGNPSIVINGAAGQTRTMNWRTNGSNRWQELASVEAESAGTNAGSELVTQAFSDANAAKTLTRARRASGPYGTGIPYFSEMSPYDMAKTRATTYGGVLGNNTNFGDTSDYQPSATLGTNPITTVNTSATITVHWPNCCGATSGVNGVPGPLYPAGNVNWVNLSGVTAVGGITPTGWLQVATLSGTDDFTVTWTAPATSSATGGGAAVVVKPSFATQGTKFWLTMTTGAAGYPIAHSDYFIANPEFYQPNSGSAVQYQRMFSQTYSPNDTSQLHAWGVVSHELDVINRGADEGYSPNLYGAPRPTIGTWSGPNADVTGFVAGGGTSQNWNTIYSCFRGGHPTGVARQIGIYDCNSNQANSLVGATNDPSGHGGVGYDFFGSYDLLANPPFATANGTSTITVTMIGADSGLATQTNGNSVYIPATYSLNGVTFGAGSYSITCVGTCLTATKFTITGSGVAGSTGPGGAAQQVVSFATLTPYAPAQAHGRWLHGFTTTSNTSFADGLFVSTQPGNGVGWNDGTGTAKVVGTEVSAGNVSVDITPAGTAPINAQGPLHLKNYTIAAGAGQIPACATALKGAMAYVTDFSGSPTYNGAIGAGGSTTGVPVACDGTSWTTH